jgi:hypothetical protein
MWRNMAKAENGNGGSWQSKMAALAAQQLASKAWRQLNQQWLKIIMAKKASQRNGGRRKWRNGGYGNINVSIMKAKIINNGNISIGGVSA